MKTIKEILEEYKKEYKLEELLIISESGRIIYWGPLEFLYNKGLEKSRLEIESWEVRKNIKCHLGKKLLIEL